jgi:RimJ/RimL family protein N-acetyltransferase
MCQLWNYDMFSSNAHITAMVAPNYMRRGWPMEGIFLFLDYCFHTYSLRKIYFESLADEAGQYRSAVGRMLRQEACLKEHRLVGGKYVDSYTFAMYNDDFQKNRERLLPFVQPLLPMDSID